MYVPVDYYDIIKQEQIDPWFLKKLYEIDLRRKDSMNIGGITITSLETITAFEVGTGNFWFVLDELQNATIAQTEDKTPITGKGGRTLSNLKRNKAVTISGTNGLVSAGLMEVQTGGTFINGKTTILWTDYLTVDDDAATTTYTAVGTVGDEIEGVYVKGADGGVIKTLTQGATVGDGVFTYAPATKTLAFKSGEIADNTEIVVYYMRQIQGNVLKNESGVYSGKAMLYVDCLGEDKCSNVYRVQFYFPKADFSGEFSMELGENQTVHNFTADALAGACGANGNYYTYTVFGANAADVASN